MAANKPWAVVVFGPQGSGKSTQVERIASKFDLEEFDTGAILRERAKTDAQLHSQISQGQLVDEETVRDIVEEELLEVRPKKGFVFDGYPRNEVEFDDFSVLAKEKSWQVVGVFINLSDESAKERLRQRFQIIDGQKVFRDDDQPAIVQKRLDTFKQETLPVKKMFEQNFQIIEIDGEPSMEQVTTEINQALTPLIHG